jgi:DNA-binding LytR/AlgR family response regulator
MTSVPPWRTFDGLFLDVRMADLDGLELAAVLRRFAHPPPIVFVSAYEGAAVAAFELRALDYLMKPVSRQRIEQAVSRVAEFADAHPATVHDEEPVQHAISDILPVDQVRGAGMRLLHRSEILFFQSYGDYVRVVSDHGRFLLRGRLAEIEQRWSPHGFLRVHRGYVANMHRASEVRPAPNGTATIVFADGIEVPVARRHVAGLRGQLHA